MQTEELIKILKKMKTEPISSFILWDLNTKVEKILKELGEYEIPVQMERLAQKLGIELERSKSKDLNPFSKGIGDLEDRTGYYRRYKDTYTGGKIINYTDIMEELPPQVESYFIGRAIGKYFISEEETVHANFYHLTTFSMFQEEEMLKELALTLLMPISLLVKVTAEEKSRGVDLMKMTQRMSERFVIVPELITYRLMEINRVLVEISTFSDNQKNKELAKKYIDSLNKVSIISPKEDGDLF